MSKKIKFKTAETAKCTYHLKSDMDKSPHYHKKGSYEFCYFVCFSLFMFVFVG